VIIYRLPAEPSRHRVAIWRELRRLGAVPLQQGPGLRPQGEEFAAGFVQVIEAIKTTGGPPVVLTVADEDAGAAQPEACSPSSGSGVSRVRQRLRQVRGRAGR
jgi:hypothetical protein